MSRSRAVVLLVLATTLWGASSAVVALLDSSASPTTVAAGAGSTLLLWACAQRQPMGALLAREWRLYLAIGGLEAINLVLYFAALSLGPAPVVVALHLSTPVLLIGYHVATRKRRLDLLSLVEIGLLVLAIVLVVRDPVKITGATEMLWACLLSLGSSVAVAILISVIASASSERPAVASAGIQLVMAAVLSAPLMFVGHWAGYRDPAILLLVGALLLGPGFVLYWNALRRLDATTAGIIGLNEALVASLLVGLLGAGDITPMTLIAGLLVLVSVGLESLSSRRRMSN